MGAELSEEASKGAPDEALPNETLPKAPTGIPGLDEITHGGLPRGRATLVSGGVGCGKTVFGVEFLVHGATEFDEPGVLMAFEESPAEIAANVRSIGFDLDRLAAEKKLSLHAVQVDRREIEETGEYDLEGLFVRLGYAIDSIGAKRVLLDTIEAIFSGFDNEAILRTELRRLFRWLKDKGVTTVITAESDGLHLTRHGLEEFLSDCVIRLDRRVNEEFAARRLEVVKYRGSDHGANAYPFLIQRGGISVLPITSIGLDHRVSNDRISSGIPRLDSMLGGEGFYRGSSVLISGTAGTGKSSIAMHAVRAATQRGERCLIFAFEESADQITRNMRSIGVDLEPPVRDGLLRFCASRPTLHGLETHLASIHREVEAFQPELVVIDPVTNFIQSGTQSQVRSMLTRLIDFLKGRQITGIFTSLTASGDALENSESEVSSLIDTWLLVKFIESDGERNRAIYVLKSRGMAHSNQIRELVITSRGIELADVYLGPSGVLTGSARFIQEARERATTARRQRDLEARQRQLELERADIERQIEALRARQSAALDELSRMSEQERQFEDVQHWDRSKLALLRSGDDTLDPPAGPQAGDTLENSLQSSLDKGR